MTRASLEDLLADLTEKQRWKEAATAPVFGEVSFDRAVNEIFGESNEGKMGVLKGLALLMRREPGKTPEEANEANFLKMITAYVERLSQEMPPIDVGADYDEFYDEAPARLIHTMDPARLRKKKAAPPQRPTLTIQTLTRQRSDIVQRMM